MEMRVSAAGDEVEGEGEQEQAGDDVEDDGGDFFFARLFPVLAVRDDWLDRLVGWAVDVALGHGGDIALLLDVIGGRLSPVAGYSGKDT
jgi:hypothetical protein